MRRELVKLFAQHGFSDGFKTVEGLRKELIDGVIFSPRDITPEKLRECASKFTESAPISERLFDPQYYATLSALDPLSRTGYLQEEYSCYFAPRWYDQLLRESQVIEGRKQSSGVRDDTATQGAHRAQYHHRPLI